MTEKFLTEICEDYFGVDYDNYHRPRESSNDIYIINVEDKNYCLKISTKGYLSSFRAEPFLQERVRNETSIPVPEVLFTDYTNYNKDFYIMEYIDARNAQEYSSLEDQKVFDQVEDYILKLEDVNFDEYGYMNWNENSKSHVFPSFKSWKKSLRAEIKTLCKSMLNSRFKYLSEYHMNFYEDNKEILDSYDFSPSLVNSDIRPANILVDKDNNIKSILDWGSCFSGDYLFCLKKAEFLMNNPSRDGNVSTSVDGDKEELFKFYDVLIWMYIMSGFENWFSHLSESTKKNLEQDIRDNYKKSVEKFEKT